MNTASQANQTLLKLCEENEIKKIKFIKDKKIKKNKKASRN
jgi:hypothetical protein